MNNVERFILKEIDWKGPLTAAQLARARWPHSREPDKKTAQFVKLLKSLANRGFVMPEHEDHANALWSRRP